MCCTYLRAYIHAVDTDCCPNRHSKPIAQKCANMHPMLVCVPVYFNIPFIVYDLKSVGALKIEFVAPMPEQNGTSTMHFSNVPGGPYVAPDTSGKCIVEVLICSGMGATNFIFGSLDCRLLGMCRLPVDCDCNTCRVR